MKEEVIEILACCFVAVLIFILGIGVGFASGRRNAEREAVLNKAAVYVVDNEGNPKFQWVNQK